MQEARIELLQRMPIFGGPASVCRRPALPPVAQTRQCDRQHQPRLQLRPEGSLHIRSAWRTVLVWAADCHATKANGGASKQVVAFPRCAGWCCGPREGVRG